MSENDYGDLVERWKVELIGRRARRLGFRDHEVPDLEQQIVPELMGLEYDPSYGASESTFVIRVIDQQFFKVLRDRRRDVRRANYEAGPVEVLDQRSYFRMSQTERVNLRMDLEAALAGLSPREKEILQALSEGLSQADLANADGKSRASVSQGVARLREKLKAWGLDEYLGR